MRTLLQIEKELDPRLVFAALDAHQRNACGAELRMKLALAAYEFEKQVLASRIDHPEPRQASHVNPGKMAP